MIIVNLKGGLGNQMFQYAAGKSLALHNNDTLKLYLGDLENGANIGDTKREFELKDFSIEAEQATKAEVIPLMPGKSMLGKVVRKMKASVWGSNHLLFDPAFFSQTGDVYVNGFWQSTRYFDSIREPLLSDFRLRASLPDIGQELAEKMQQSNSVCIHIRRGDYAQNPLVRRQFGLCSTAYYQRAIAHIKERVSNPAFFVFSDDPDWVKENLDLGVNAEVTYIPLSGLSPSETLVLMSLCQHNIIANSSFSWWGAYLNQNPGKIVVAPTPWFDRLRYDQDLLPKTWTLLQKH